MVIAIPLPFLDYHPLVQPVGKSTIQSFRHQVRVFWCLIIVQAFSSIVYLVCQPEPGMESIFMPLPSALGVYVAWTLVPMRFFALSFLAMPLDICIGVQFISHMQKPSYGFPPKLFFRLTDDDIKHTMNLRGRKFAIDPVLVMASQTESSKLLKKEDFKISDKALSNLKPIGSPTIIAENRNEKVEKWLNQNNDNLQESNIIAKLPNGSSRKLVAASRSFSELTMLEKVHLINLFVYSAVGVLYCFLSWYFYRKLGDAAAEELRNPMHPSTGAEQHNPLFAPPHSDLQEPSPLYPFAGIGDRLGSDAIVKL